MTLKEFIETNKIGMNAVKCFSNPNMEQKDWKANHYSISFNRPLSGSKTVEFTTFFSMGIGNKGRPNAETVLYCIKMDADALNQTFSDWADNFGYDTDSIKALKTYEACFKIGEKLKEFLGRDLFNQLLECEGL